MEFDSIDWRLLDLLQHDAAVSNQALAERAGVSPPTALRRVRRLSEAGGFFVRIAAYENLVETGSSGARQDFAGSPGRRTGVA